MTSPKMNHAIIKSIMDALSRVDFDPFLASPIPPRPGFFASDSDKFDAENAPDHIIALLKIQAQKGQPVPKEQMEHYVKKEVWARAGHRTLGEISTDATVGKTSASKFQYVQEAVRELRKLGEDSEALVLEGFLEMEIEKLNERVKGFLKRK